MTTTIAPPSRTLQPGSGGIHAPAPSRGAPGLTVLALPVAQFPLAGYLLRHGPALTLVESPPHPVAMSAATAGVAMLVHHPAALEAGRQAAAERALAATVNAGFEVRAVETVTPDQICERLRCLEGAEIGCVVVEAGSARRVRSLARAAGAPVLVLPPGAGPAGGPAVFSAADAGRAAPAAARALATEDAIVVAGFEPTPPGTLSRTAGHPGLLPRLHELEDRLRRMEVDAASRRAEHGVRLAEGQGLRAHPVAMADRRPLLRSVIEWEGILVLADPGGPRVPRLLRDALCERRPVLVVPPAGA